MTILALEFSSLQRSVAVARPGSGSAVHEIIESGGSGTNAFGMIERVLGEAKVEREQIDLIAVGLGPGSYTGIRVAISLAQGWQLARGAHTIGVSSVAAIAAQVRIEWLFGRVHIVVDAQRQEFYLATYEINETSATEIAPLKILPRAEVQRRTEKGEIVVGPDAETFKGLAIFPGAADVARLAASGIVLPGDKLEPIYLRETNFVKHR